MTDKALFDAWKNALERSWLNDERLRLEAQDTPLPEDIAGLLDEDSRHVATLPDYLPQKAVLLQQIELARTLFDKGAIESLKGALLAIQMNWDNAQHDKWVNGVEKQFGKAADHRAKIIQEQREPVWDSWKKEADRIQRMARRKMSKRELAKKVKASLKVLDSIETIRKKI